MKYFEHATGRTYNTPQVLAITVDEYGFDEYGVGVITASFTDSSRHIKGRVINYPVFCGDLGGAILSAYDTGNFESI